MNKRQLKKKAKQYQNLREQYYKVSNINLKDLEIIKTYVLMNIRSCLKSLEKHHGPWAKLASRDHLINPKMAFGAERWKWLPRLFCPGLHKNSSNLWILGIMTYMSKYSDQELDEVTAHMGW